MVGHLPAITDQASWATTRALAEAVATASTAAGGIAVVFGRAWAFESVKVLVATVLPAAGLQLPLVLLRPPFIAGWWGPQHQRLLRLRAWAFIGGRRQPWRLAWGFQIAAGFAG